jgi:hypothetical protein
VDFSPGFRSKFPDSPIGIKWRDFLNTTSEKENSCFQSPKIIKGFGKKAKNLFQQKIKSEKNNITIN